MLDRDSNNHILLTGTLMVSACTFALVVQSLLLVSNESISYLKVNLIIQLFLLVLFGLWSYIASGGKYLNAPFIFIAAIYIWHSPFLTGHYFELAKIFEWTGRHFTYGEEFIPRATGLVGLCLSAGVAGTMLGYGQQAARTEEEADSPVSGAMPKTVHIDARRIIWLFFIGYGLLTLVYLLKEGMGALSGDYLSLYTEHSDTLLYRLYQSTKFYFSIIMLALFAFVTSRREFWCAFALTIFIIAVQFLLGSRSIPFINLLAVALCVDYFVRKIPFLLLTCGFLLLSALSFVIQYARVEGVLNIFSFDAADKEINLLHMFWELGGVIRNVIRTMAFMGPEGIVHGQTFFNSIVYLLPKFYLDGLGYQPGILRPSEWLIEHSADIPYGGGIGYSLVAETYYNFGLAGAFLFFLLGWFVAAKYFVFIRTGDRFSLLHALNIVIILSLHMRNDTEAYLRYIVYGSMFIELLRWVDRKKLGAVVDSGKKN